MEANVEAALKKLKEIWYDTPGDGPVMYPDIEAILLALQTPVAGKEEKVDQTLAEKIRKARYFLTPESSEYLAEIATSHFQPIIEQARNEGYLKGIENVAIAHRNGIAGGKRLAIAEMKEKLELWTSNTWMNKREFSIDKLKVELFGQDK